MINPNKWIRKAYISALAGVSIGSVNVPIYDRRIPKNDDIPSTYILISTQSKNIASESKCGHGWNCSILLDIITEQPASFVNMAICDDIEEQISYLIDVWQATGSEFMIPPFTCYHTTLGDEHDIILETPTVTIIRKLLRYNHRLNGLD